MSNACYLRNETKPSKKKEREDIVLYTSANPHAKSEAVLDMYNLSQKSEPFV